jgi:hypothetical protein
MADLTTVGGHPATIAATATKLLVSKESGQRGKVYNVGAKTVYIGTNDGAAVTADGTQENHKLVITSLAFPVSIPRGCKLFYVICAGTDTTTLLWIPED